jgi:maleamate amidohydrolase
MSPEVAATPSPSPDPAAARAPAAPLIPAALVENYSGVFDGKVGFGQRPALVIVDFMRGYTTPGEPFYAYDVVQAVAATRPLLAAARHNRVPVVFTRVSYASAGAAEGGLFVRKVPSLRRLVDGQPAAEIVPELAPGEGEVVLNKHYASAFFGTSLAPLLRGLGVDTLVLTGCSTSGCVRATAVDGMQHGFRVIVPRECVGDRAQEPHAANLFDIDAKYGDVVAVAEVLARFAALGAAAAAAPASPGAPLEEVR